MAEIYNEAGKPKFLRGMATSKSDLLLVRVDGVVDSDVTQMYRTSTLSALRRRTQLQCLTPTTTNRASSTYVPLPPPLLPFPI